MKDARTITVVVADASRMTCRLLADAIRRHKYCRVTACVTSSAEAIAAVCEGQPDVTLLSARLDDDPFGGILTLRKLRGLQSKSRIIMLLDNDERELVVEILRNGARGIFCRTGSFGELHKCIRRIHEGQIWVNNAEAQYVVEALMQARGSKVSNTKMSSALSKREKEVAWLVAAGLSNRGVSERLGLSEHTVKNYLFSIFEKLNISTRIELLLYVLSQPAKPAESQKHGPADAVLGAGA